MFPDWIKEEKKDTFLINADVAYPALLTELKDSIKDLPDDLDKFEMPFINELRNIDLDNLTQYWIEVVYQMAKLELRRILLINGKNQWPDMIRISGNKEKWALKNFPPGRGAETATKGREARDHYKRLKGFIPN